MRRLDGQRPRPRIGWSRVAPPPSAICRECGLRHKQHAGLCRQCQRRAGDRSTYFERERAEVLKAESRERARMREAERLRLERVEKPERVVVADGLEWIVAWDGAVHP